MSGQLSPSMMCCELMEMKETLRQFEDLGIEYLHIDIMDGVFVPNYTLGTDYVRMIRKYTKIPLDIHMMVINPEERLHWFEFGEGDNVSVHLESTAHIHRAIMKIKEKGANAMAAINPGTSLHCLRPLLGEIDGVLIMTVDPGFAGQKLVESTLTKIKELKKMLADEGVSAVRIEVDGNVNLANAKRMRQAGADIFVVGTSGMFIQGQSFIESANRIRSVIA